ncbi:MAG: hypothetical protein ABW061_20835 [Polyangiaceae bacterium]
MTQRFWCAAVGFAFGLAGCHSQASEPPPPPATFDLAVAPPGARGARAAGTDAAPPAPSEGELSDPGSPDPEPEPESEPEEEDAGSAAQGGAPAVPVPGVAL